MKGTEFVGKAWTRGPGRDKGGRVGQLKTIRKLIGRKARTYGKRVGHKAGATENNKKIIVEWALDNGNTVDTRGVFLAGVFPLGGWRDSLWELSGERNTP